MTSSLLSKLLNVRAGTLLAIFSIGHGPTLLAEVPDTPIKVVPVNYAEGTAAFGADQREAALRDLEKVAGFEKVREWAWMYDSLTLDPVQRYVILGSIRRDLPEATRHLLNRCPGASARDEAEAFTSGACYDTLTTAVLRVSQSPLGIVRIDPLSRTFDQIVGDHGLISDTVYGCYSSFAPMHLADVDANQRDNLLLVTGTGSVDSGGGVNARSDLQIFSDQAPFTLLLEIALSDEARDGGGEYGLRTGDARVYYSERIAPDYQGMYPPPPEQIGPADATYAKVYFADFNQNGHPDILVWRQHYQAKKIGAPLPAFGRVAQTYEWYELDQGQFRPLSIDEKSAQGYLSRAQLGWHDGFPGKSYCANSERGQQITVPPEDHAFNAH